MTRRLLLAAIAVLGLAAPAAATTYYVDSSCANNGNGLADACAASPGGAGAVNQATGTPSLASLIAAAVADDIILVKNGSGTYVNTSNGTDSSENGGFSFGHSGTAGHVITLKAYPGHAPLLANCADGATTWAACDNPTITAENKAYITIDGIRVRGGMWLMTSGSANEAALSQGITVKNTECTVGWGEVDDGNWTCLFLQEKRFAQVDHNNFHDLAPTTGAGQQSSGSCFKLYTSVDTTIEFNTCKNVDMIGSGTASSAGGIDDKQDTVRNTHRYNWIENTPGCLRFHNQHGTAGYTHGTGTQAYGNVCIGRNDAQVRDGWRVVEGAGAILDDLKIFNNTFYRYNNGAQIFASDAGAGGTQGLQSYNNIYANIGAELNIQSYQAGEFALLDYDAYDSGNTFKVGTANYANLAALVAGTPFGDHSHATACSFVAAPTDFHLSGGICQTGGKVGGTAAGATIEQGAYGVTTCVGHTCGAVTPAPTVSSVSPTSGSTAGGTTLTITGANFVATPTSVTVFGVACGTIHFTSSTQIECVTGAAAAGLGNVVVTNPDAQSGTLVGGFTYIAPSPGVRMPIRFGEAQP